MHDVESWDDHFVENVIVKDVTRTFATNEIRRKAQAIYKEEWERLAVEGKVKFASAAQTPLSATVFGVVLPKREIFIDAKTVPLPNGW